MVGVLLQSLAAGEDTLAAAEDILAAAEDTLAAAEDIPAAAEDIPAAAGDRHPEGDTLAAGEDRRPAGPERVLTSSLVVSSWNSSDEVLICRGRCVPLPRLGHFFLCVIAAPIMCNWVNIPK